MIDRSASTHFLRGSDGQLICAGSPTETFADTVPNYPMLPRVSKNLAGQDIDRHAARAQGIAGTESRELTTDELLLTSPVVYGFSFADKQWCE